MILYFQLSFWGLYDGLLSLPRRPVVLRVRMCVYHEGRRDHVM